jgi:hypothetical protein
MRACVSWTSCCNDVLATRRSSTQSRQCTGDTDLLFVGMLYEELDLLIMPQSKVAYNGGQDNPTASQE